MKPSTLLLLMACGNTQILSPPEGKVDSGQQPDERDTGGLSNPDTGGIADPDTGSWSDGGADSPSPDSDPPEDSGGGTDSAAATDSGAASGGEGEAPLEDLGEAPDPLLRFFSLDEVHEVEITLSTDAMRSLRTLPYEYVVSQISFDGLPLDDVAIRIKGRYGSLDSVTGKPAWKLDINRWDSSQNLHGLKKLNLNNMRQDGAAVREYMAYGLFRAAGVPAPRVGYAWVRVNGADYGLYSMIEAYDQHMLSDQMEEPEGNLYDGDYKLWDSGGYSLVDFYDSVDSLYILDVGVDVSLVDIKAVTEALDTTPPDQIDETIGSVVDLDQFLTYWALETWIGQYDGYAYNQNNYRVYFHPSTGLAQMLPWDPDWAYYSGTPISSPRGRLAAACWMDSSCRELFKARVDEICTLAESLDQPTTLAQVTALINPYLALDTRRSTAYGSTLTGQSEINSWLSSRSASLRSYYGL